MSSGTALEWHSSASPALGSLLGFRVVESRNIPPHQIYKIGNELHLRSFWDDLQLPLMIADMRKAMRAHLAELVAAAEQRLGLDRP